MSRTFYLDPKVGDIYIDNSGKSYIIDGEQKLKQDILQSLVLDYDPQRDYGRKLQVGELQDDQYFVGENYVELEINNALLRLLEYQSNDGWLTEEEEISSIDEVTVKALNDTDYIFYVSVTTTAGRNLKATLKG